MTRAKSLDRPTPNCRLKKLWILGEERALRDFATVTTFRRTGSSLERPEPILKT
jgi:hypothetical protein